MIPYFMMTFLYPDFGLNFENHLSCFLSQAFHSRRIQSPRLMNVCSFSFFLSFSSLFCMRLFCCWYKTGREEWLRKERKEWKRGFQGWDDHEHHHLHGWCCYFHPSQKMKNEKTTSSLTFSLSPLCRILPLPFLWNKERQEDIQRLTLQ